MPLILHKDSHTDHVDPKIITLALDHFRNKGEFFAETIELPEGMTVSCGLHGPVVGDEPITEKEVRYEARNGWTWTSRLVLRQPRLTRTLTVIGGPHDNHNCVLYTIFGGPLAPKEPSDPTLEEKNREASTAFWQEHALSY